MTEQLRLSCADWKLKRRFADLKTRKYFFFYNNSIGGDRLKV